MQLQSMNLAILTWELASDQLGGMSIGKKANLLITKLWNHYYEIPYNFGSNIIEQIT